MAIKEAYTTKELVSILGIAQQNVHARAKREGWQSQPRKGRGGGSEWFLSSMPESTRLAIRNAQEAKLLATTLSQTSTLPPSECNVEPTIVLDSKRQEKALLRADLLRCYISHQERYGFTVVAKQSFIIKYESGAYPYIYMTWWALYRGKPLNDGSRSRLSPQV